MNKTYSVDNLGWQNIAQIPAPPGIESFVVRQFLLLENKRHPNSENMFWKIRKFIMKYLPRVLIVKQTTKT